MNKINLKTKDWSRILVIFLLNKLYVCTMSLKIVEHYFISIKKVFTQTLELFIQYVCVSITGARNQAKVYAAL